MNSKNHYKEKFWDYSNDELKDIISDRFQEHSEEAVTAAMELLRERSGDTAEFGEISLAQIPGASMTVLLRIVKNPHQWSKDAVDIAEAEIIRREQNPSSGTSNHSGGNKTWLQALLAIIGVILSVVLVKVLAGLVVIMVFFYCVISCLDKM